MSDRAHVFIRFGDRNQLEAASASLSDLMTVSRWEAIEGPYQLAIRLTGDVDASLATLTAAAGEIETAACHIKDEQDTAITVDPEICYSYVLIEAVPDSATSVQKAVSEFEQTVFCNITDGPYDLIAMVSGPSFDHIDRLIAEQIGTIDGVLRLKEGRILSSIVK